MRNFLFFVCVACIAMVTRAAVPASNGYPIANVPFTAVKIAPASLLGSRIAAAQNVTIPLAFSKCESEGRYSNFEKAATPSNKYKIDSFMGFPFDDTDVYKTIEGASYVLQTYPDKALEAYIDSILDIVAAAQESDGYLYTARTINPRHPHSWAGKKRWKKEEIMSHELYNLGHMLEAACAHYQATGSTKFLDIAKKYADCVCREIGPAEDQEHVVPGHQIAEMGLARLYLITGDKKYLDEAKYFLDLRGNTSWKKKYSQSHTPVTEQDEAVGHAVRAGYMYAGMADVAALTGDEDYIRAIDKIWDNIINYKYYITGGVGARHEGEAYGDDYELPNLTAYNETCAAIAMVYFAQRMFLLHGDAQYIDCLERTLYNGVFSGMSIDGGKFFYPNPLEANGKYKFNSEKTMERQPWFGCACCPSNLSRFIPSMPGYIYAVKGSDIYVNLYNANTATIATDKGNVTLCQTTNYPLDGGIAIEIIDSETNDFTLSLRIPGWVRGEVTPGSLYHYCDNVQSSYSVSVNGQPVEGALRNGYIDINRQWNKGDIVNIHLDMQPREIRAIDKIADDRGKVAFERGPLVYCAEEIDNTIDPLHTIIDTSAPLDTQFVADKIGGICEIIAKGTAAEKHASSSSQQTLQTITLIPYYAWNHRGVGKMAVWLAATPAP